MKPSSVLLEGGGRRHAVAVLFLFAAACSSTGTDGRAAGDGGGGAPPPPAWRERLYPPLHDEARRGEAEAIREAAGRGVAVSAPDVYGFTPLHWAAAEGREEAVKALLEAGADVHARDVCGDTPLLCSLRRNHIKIAEALLDAPSNLYVQDHRGDTPLHLAVATGRTDLVRRFLDRNPPKRARNRDGKTPADIARTKGHREIYRLLTGQEWVPTGSPYSENAVEKGLLWLARCQREDGSWTSGTNASGPAEPRPAGKTTAGDGLALLAFLSAGYTEKHSWGVHYLRARRGIIALLRRQRDDGFIGNAGSSPLTRTDFRSHLVAALALSEGAAMDGVPATADAAGRAFEWSCANAQAFLKNHGSAAAAAGSETIDLSDAAWFAFLLASSSKRGTPVPQETRARIAAFLDEATNREDKDPDFGGAAWRPGERPLTGATATAIAARLKLDASPGDRIIRAGVDRILADLPSKDRFDPQTWFFGTLAMFDAGGEAWNQWNEALRDPLISLQVREAGSKDDGSFAPPETGWAAEDRLLTTGLSLLALHVYYRYLPLFR